MLDGRYPSQEFSELRPRIVWDRVGGSIRARKGSRQLAVTNAGTIPDRGLLLRRAARRPSRRRARRGDGLRGPCRARRSCSAPSRGGSRRSGVTASSSRPRPALPGQCRSGAATASGGPRSSARRSAPSAAGRSTRPPRRSSAEYDLDAEPHATSSPSCASSRKPRASCPSDRTIVVERFRDEIGDWRLCILSPFGGRVHAAWGLALSARIRDEFGLESDAIWSDDGIIVHLPDADELGGADVELVLLDPDEVEDAVVAELGGSALFGARFRENAGRALLIPRAYPGKRTPLWQQRLKSQSLLEVAKRYGDFPIILETYRECLRDVLDVPGLIEILRQLHAREISLVEVETQTASPFASVAAVRLRRDLHVRGRHAQRRAAGRGALAGPRPAARAARPGGAARPHRRRRAGPGRGRPPAPQRADAGRRPRRAGRRPAPRGRPLAAPRPGRAWSTGSIPSRCSPTSSASGAR